MTSSGVSKIGNVMTLTRGSEIGNVAEKSNDFGLLLNQKTAADGELFRQPEAEQFMSRETMAYPNPGELTDTRQSYEKETGKMTWDRVPKAAEGTVDRSLTPETKDALSQWQEKVKKVLTEKLDVSEEELTDAMERLGITFENLLTGQGLQELCMELTGASDITDLLLDGSFTELMQEVGVLVNQLSEQMGLSPEELQMLMQKAMEETQVTEGMEAEIPEQKPGMETLPPEAVDGAVMEESTQEPTAAPGQPTVAPGETQTAVETADQEQRVTQTTDQKQAPVQTTQQQTTETPADKQELPTEAVEEPQEPSQKGALNQQEAELSQNGENSGEEGKELSNQGKGQAAERQQISRPEPESQQVSYHTTVQNTVTGTGEAVVQTVQRTFVDVQNILQQISEFTRVTVTPDVSRLEMQLNPEHLGKLFMQLSAKEGVITAQLIAQNEAVKNALESQVNVLKENMNNQGMKVEAVEVTVASHEFEEQFQGEQQAGGQQEEGSHRQRRFLNVDQLEEMAGQLSEEDSLAAKIMVENGNSVDMTA